MVRIAVVEGRVRLLLLLVGRIAVVGMNIIMVITMIVD